MQDVVHQEVERMLRTPNGTIAKHERENHAGEKGPQHTHVTSVALKFVQATHQQPCDCRYCSIG